LKVKLGVFSKSKNSFFVEIDQRTSIEIKLYVKKAIMERMAHIKKLVKDL
jgi:hypothetical protein